MVNRNEEIWRRAVERRVQQSGEGYRKRAESLYGINGVPDHIANQIKQEIKNEKRESAERYRTPPYQYSGKDYAQLRGGNCFPAGTKLLVGSGKEYQNRPIEETSVNDKIVCFNYETEE